MKAAITVSILLCLFVIRGRGQAQSGSPFFNGFARISRGDSSFYIDTGGTVAFDSLAGSFDLRDDTSGGTLPEHAPQVFKGSKMGVLDLDGSWLLTPLYDSIDQRWPIAWKVSRDGKTSFFRRSGFVLPFRYEDVLWLDSNYFAVKQQGKWGVYSRRDDRVLIPFQYDDIDYCSGCTAEGDYVFAAKAGKWGVVSFSGKVLVPFVYDHEHMNMRSDEWVECLWLDGKNVLINLNTGKVDTCNCSPDNDAVEGTPLPFPLVGITKGDKFGVADTGGRVIVPCVYDQWFSTTSDSTLLVGGKGKRDILLDLHGKPVLPPGYDTLEEMSNGFIKLTKHGLFGLYNTHTRRIVVPRYTKLEEGDYHLDRPVLEAYMGKKRGLIDGNGTVLIPPAYDFLDETNSDGLLWVKSYRKQVLKTGLYSISRHKVLFPVVYDDLRFYDDNEQLIAAQKGDLFGILGINGDTVCAPVYDDITEVDSIHFLLKRHNRYSVLNTAVRAIDTLAFDSVIVARYGSLLIVKTGGDRRLYDASSKAFLPGSYTDIATYDAGLFMVTQGSLYGFIDPSGKVIVPVTYDNASAFTNGVAMIFRKRPDMDLYRYGFIDTTGKIIVPIDYDYSPEAYASDYFQDGYLVLKKGDMSTQCGLASRDGKVIVPAVYDRVDVLHPGTWFLVKKDDRLGLLDSKGGVFLADNCVDMGAETGHPLYFPLLYRVGDSWRYITKEGKVLPYVFKEVSTF